MTLDRVKYLSEISNEERAIRNALKYNKGCLKECKRICSLNGNYYRWKEPMTVTKSIIKSLKKQLPAPRKIIELPYGEFDVCPICKRLARFNYVFYCNRCGQKLR